MKRVRKIKVDYFNGEDGRKFKCILGGERDTAIIFRVHMLIAKPSFPDMQLTRQYIQEEDNVIDK